MAKHLLSAPRPLQVQVEGLTVEAMKAARGRLAAPYCPTLFSIGECVCLFLCREELYESLISCLWELASLLKGSHSTGGLIGDPMRRRVPTVRPFRVIYILMWVIPIVRTRMWLVAHMRQCLPRY
jgi:hypothetical protein